VAGICKAINAITSFASPRKIGLRAADYLLLCDVGAFEGYGRTELIEGEIWAVNAIHARHAKAMADLTTDLGVSLRNSGSCLRVFSAGSVFLSDTSVPEPDISIGEDNDVGVLPLTNLKLAVEISDTTIATDLGVKLRIYAQAGVPEYWVVDREAAVVHQFWGPIDGIYTERRAVAFGNDVASVTLMGITAPTERIR